MINKDDIYKTIGKIHLNWEKWGVLINFVMLLIVLIQLFNIQIPIPSFNEKEYEIYNVEPEDFPTGLSLLNTSPAYYVEMQVNTISQIEYGKNVKFSIDTKNKGKKDIEKPEYRVLICDSLGRIRGTYPKISTPVHTFNDLLSPKDDVFLEENDKLNFIFKLPPEDQKVIGDWRIYAYLFDKSSNSLISYNIQDFKVSENNSSSIWTNPIVTGFIATIIGGFILKTLKLD